MLITEADSAQRLPLVVALRLAQVDLVAVVQVFQGVLEIFSYHVRQKGNGILTRFIATAEALKYTLRRRDGKFLCPAVRADPYIAGAALLQLHVIADHVKQVGGVLNFFDILLLVKRSAMNHGRSIWRV